MRRSLDTYRHDRLDPDLTTGLILCGMGGPDGPDAVEPFLRNLFADPAIFPLPRLLAPLVGRWIARRRAPQVRANYAAVSHTSATPQLKTTRQQAAALAARLGEHGHHTLPGVAMRYWDPFPAQTVAELTAAGARQFLVIPAYPQFSWATSGSTLDFVCAAIGPRIPVATVPDWHLLPGYLIALAQPVIDTLTAWANAGRDPHQTGLQYVAHSLPERFIRQGDPYLDRSQATVRAVHQLVTTALGDAGHGAWLDGLHTGGDTPELVFQSKGGPMAWLGPQIAKAAPDLAAAGVRSLCVQPVSFTCEHVETLLELDRDVRAATIAAGLAEFARGPALNLNAIWLDSLSESAAQAAWPQEVKHHGRTI